MKTPRLYTDSLTFPYLKVDKEPNLEEAHLPKSKRTRRTKPGEPLFTSSEEEEETEEPAKKKPKKGKGKGKGKKSGAKEDDE